MTIRAPGREHAHAIAWVVHDSYRLLPARHVPADMPIFYASHHLKAMDDPATRWALLEDRGHPAGLAMWRMMAGMSHLHMLFVAGDFQGRGHGSRLLKHHQAEALAESGDTRLFTLHCLRDSTWAMRFYKRHGYTLYEPGDEGRVTDLYLWIDACRSHDNSWPLNPNKALFYRRAH